MADFKFDKVKVNTELAEEYLNKYNYEFWTSNTNKQTTSKMTEDAYKNKIYYFPWTVIHKKPSELRDSETFNKLAKKLEDNAELFAQLDYLIRGNSMDDVKNDVKILIKQCLNFPRLPGPSKNVFSTIIAVGEHDSLLSLLSVIRSMMWYGNFILISTDVNTAVISFLFTQLCHEVGIADTGFYLSKFEKEPYYIGEKSGCVGVITATSDIESAVDAFLSSSKKANYPWKLRRVLVQESVYDTFKRSMKWKCDKNPRNNEEVDANIKSACTDVFLYDKNQFLLDFVGIETPSNGIRVESYRTAKELLGILKKYKMLRFLSLWCSDISEANEIAYGVPSMSVWINDFGHVDGPAEILYALKSSDEVGASWQKLSENERRKILLSFLDEPLFKENYTNDVVDLRRRLLQNVSNTVYIQNNRLYVCIDKSMIFTSLDECLDNLHCLLNGTVLYFINDSDKLEIIKLFEKFDLPIYCEIKNPECGPDANFVTTNFGTTFAN